MASETYLRLRQRSPLTIESGFDKDPSKIAMRQLTIEMDGGDTRKVKVPSVVLENGEYIMYAIAEFDEVADQYQFDADDKFKYFRMAMTAESKQSWDGVADGVAHTDATFITTRASFLRTYFTRQAFHHFVEYIRAYKKRNNMPAQALAARVKTMFLYASKLPGYQDIPEAEKKQYYIRMFPEEQQNEFQRVHPDIVNLEMPDIAEFFATYDQPLKKRPAKASLTSPSPNNGGGGGSDEPTGRRKKHRRGRNRNNSDGQSHGTQGSDGHAGGQQNSSGAPRAGDKCPVHAYLGNDRNHLWGECRLNPGGQNYRPRAPGGQNQSRQQQPHAGHGSYYAAMPYTANGGPPGSFFNAPSAPQSSGNPPLGPPPAPYYQQSGYFPPPGNNNNSFGGQRN